MIFKAKSEAQASEWVARLKKARIHAVRARKNQTEVHVADELAEKASAVINPPPPKPKPVKKDNPLSKSTVARLVKHFEAATEITRIPPHKEAIWTAVFKLSFDGETWDAISDAMFECAHDDALIKAIGSGRGMQIQALYVSEEDKEDYTSLSAATRVEVSFSQAGKSAKKYSGNYHSSVVLALYFYIK